MSDRDNNFSNSEIIDNSISPTSNSKQTIYITELDDEFVAIDYSSDRKSPKIVPLSKVNFKSEMDLALQEPPQISGNLPGRPQSTKKGLVMGMGLGLVIAVGVNYLFSSLSHKNAVLVSSEDVPPAQVAPKTVTVVEVTSRPIEKTIEASGTVYASELIPVMTPAIGLQIKNILADEGNFVTKGQILTKLDDSTLQAELIQAQARVRQAEARLAELKAGTRSEEIARAKERVISAEAAVLQAESDLELVNKRAERNRALETEGAISRDRLDEILTQERISRANLEQAKASVQEAKQALAQMQAGERPEVISQAQAEVMQAKGKLKYIQAQLKDTIVTAPASGIVAERNAKLGELTSPSKTLFSIIENGILELRLKVPETLIGEIRPQQKVNIIADNLNIPTITGIVREIDPIVDGDSRQATVKVDLPSKLNLKPGMFLRAAITTSQTTGETVPTKALLPQPDGTALAFVVQPDNTVKGRLVKMGEILPNDQIEVISGLQSGDRIVLKGAAYLKDGDQVTINQDVTKQ
ncbi:MAG: efflux RND transporter periplasmic adaptor subunit [Xenococcaceae cyanobacterium MO_207.B15]|nr:efflux RND transporter periplasmic adaptor subunit [Xenococcaceae cyanobacterium MO_207.B15]